MCKTEKNQYTTLSLHSRAGNVWFPTWEHLIPRLGIKKHIDNKEIKDSCKYKWWLLCNKRPLFTNKGTLLKIPHPSRQPIGSPLNKGILWIPSLPWSPPSSLPYLSRQPSHCHLVKSPIDFNIWNFNTNIRGKTCKTQKNFVSLRSKTRCCLRSAIQTRLIALA
jgi:hypothetical protein